jgi:hypothetical protein
VCADERARPRASHKARPATSGLKIALQVSWDFGHSVGGLRNQLIDDRIENVSMFHQVSPACSVFSP